MIHDPCTNTLAWGIIMGEGDKWSGFIMQIKIVIDFWLCLVWFRLLKHLTRPQYKEVLFKQTTYRLQHCLHRLSQSNSVFTKYNWFWWKPFNLQFKLYKSNTLWRSKFTFCTNVGKVYYFLTIFRGLDISKIFYDRSKTTTIKNIFGIY